MMSAAVTPSTSCSATRRSGAATSRASPSTPMFGLRRNSWRMSPSSARRIGSRSGGWGSVVPWTLTSALDAERQRRPVSGVKTQADDMHAVPSLTGESARGARVRSRSGFSVAVSATVPPGGWSARARYGDDGEARGDTTQRRRLGTSATTATATRAETVLLTIVDHGCASGPFGMPKSRIAGRAERRDQHQGATPPACAGGMSIAATATPASPALERNDFPATREWHRRCRDVQSRANTEVPAVSGRPSPPAAPVPGCAFANNRCAGRRRRGQPARAVGSAGARFAVPEQHRTVLGEERVLKAAIQRAGDVEEHRCREWINGRGPGVSAAPNRQRLVDATVTREAASGSVAPRRLGHHREHHACDPADEHHASPPPPPSDQRRRGDGEKAGRPRKPKATWRTRSSGSRRVSETRHRDSRQKIWPQRRRRRRWSQAGRPASRPEEKRREADEDRCVGAAEPAPAGASRAASPASCG